MNNNNNNNNNNNITTTTTTITKPFLKWAGGKGQLLSVIDETYLTPAFAIHKEPQSCCYVEPFVGAGAVLFHVLRKYKDKLDSVIINDSNHKLMATYHAIKSHPQQVIATLQELEDTYNNLTSLEERQVMFLDKRRVFNSSPEEIPFTSESVNELVTNAVLFIFLNKTCFNGLYRVNRKGEFNTSFGKHKRINLRLGELQEVSKLLQKVTILCGDYSHCVDRRGSALQSIYYIDPPYRAEVDKPTPMYTKEGEFSDASQVALKEFCDGIKGSICGSNSDRNGNDTFFDNLYKEYNIKRITARRCISGDGTKRQRVSEVLIYRL